MVEAIRNEMAVRVMKRAGIFREMRMVMGKCGEAQVRFIVKHHGVTSVMRRRAAVKLAKSMIKFQREDEYKRLVWTD